MFELNILGRGACVEDAGLNLAQTRLTYIYRVVVLKWKMLVLIWHQAQIKFPFPCLIYNFFLFLCAGAQNI